MPKYLFVLLHTLVTIALTTALLSGLRIASISKDALLAFDPLLPSGLVHQLHWFAACLLLLTATVYIIYHVFYARSANDPKDWTLDLASIQQFKVISVKPDELVLRTAQFDASASTLTKAQRDADPLLLPSNVNWWSAAEVGNAMTLVKASNGLVKLKADDPIDPPSAEIKNGETKANLTATKTQPLNFTINVPSGASNLNVETSGGTGDVDLYVRYGSKPTSNSYDCRPYKSGNNEACNIASPSVGTYYIQLNAFTDFSGVSLKAQYQTSGPHGGETKPNLSAAKDQWFNYSFVLPEGVSSLSLKIAGGTGDADLYVRQGSTPTTSSYDCRPYKNGNTESCTIASPKAGTWHIGLRAYAAFSGVTLTYEY